jgi:hypothetical protein
MSRSVSRIDKALYPLIAAIAQAIIHAPQSYPLRCIGNVERWNHYKYSIHIYTDILTSMSLATQAPFWTLPDTFNALPMKLYTAYILCQYQLKLIYFGRTLTSSSQCSRLAKLSKCNSSFFAISATIIVQCRYGSDRWIGNIHLSRVSKPVYLMRIYKLSSADTADVSTYVEKIAYVD